MFIVQRALLLLLLLMLFGPKVAQKRQKSLRRRHGGAGRTPCEAYQTQMTFDSQWVGTWLSWCLGFYVTTASGLGAVGVVLTEYGRSCGLRRCTVGPNAWLIVSVVDRRLLLFVVTVQHFNTVHELTFTCSSRGVQLRRHAERHRSPRGARDNGSDSRLGAGVG